MGTIAEKLTYLNDTRLKIKDGLNKFGADLTENDTFRSYSNVLNGIYNKLPKVSGNGSNFTLENAQNGKLDLFEMEGNTHQDSYSGINIYNVNDTKVNVSPEIEILSNDYVSCTYDNTNNSTIHYSNFMIGKTPQLQTSTNYLVVCEIQKVSGTGYLYPFTKHPNSCIDTQHTLYSFSDLLAGQKLLIPVTTVSSFDGTSSDLRTLVRYNAGNSGSITFRLSLLTDTTITSDTFVYEPYVGGTPSPNPDYPQDIEVVTGNNTINVGENVFFNNSLEYGYYAQNNGNKQNPPDTQGARSSSPSLVKPNTTYVLKIDGNTYTKAVRYFFYGSNNNFLETISSSNGEFTTPSNCYYVNFHSTAIKVDYPNLDANIKIIEPNKYAEYPINLGNIELCKIGDYQDVIFKNNQLSEYYDSTLDEDSWYIKKETGKVVFDGTEDWYKYNITTNNLYRLNGTIFEGYAYGTNIADAFCNIYGVTNLSGLHDTDSTFKGVGIRDNGQINIWTSLNEYTTIAAFKNMLLNKNMTIVGRLKDTTYEKITNETLISQLEAIETETGTNIFEVSNDNDVLPSLNVKRLKELEKLS